MKNLLMNEKHETVNARVLFERVNQTLEDLLRACVLDFGGSWEDHISLVEFSYNNSFQSSIGMTPFEALYGRP